MDQLLRRPGGRVVYDHRSWDRTQSELIGERQGGKLARRSGGVVWVGQGMRGWFGMNRDMGSVRCANGSQTPEGTAARDDSAGISRWRCLTPSLPACILAKRQVFDLD